MALFVWFALPESVPDVNERRALRAQQLLSMGTGTTNRRRQLASMFDVVSPFSVLLPRNVIYAGRRSVDWSMALVGAAYALAMLIGQSGSRNKYIVWYFESAAIAEAEYVRRVFGWQALDVRTSIRLTSE